MDDITLPKLAGPRDHLRLGFASMQTDMISKHPIEALQGNRISDRMRIESVRQMYGIHMAMRLATEQKLSSRLRRLPGLECSSIGQEILVGTDRFIDFADVYSGGNVNVNSF